MRATLGRGFYADDQCSCLVVVVYTDNMIKSATSSAGKCTTLYCRAVVVYTDNMIKSATSDPLVLFFSLGLWVIGCCKLPQVYWRVTSSPKHHRRKNNRTWRLLWLFQSSATTTTATLVPVASHRDHTSHHRLHLVASAE